MPSAPRDILMHVLLPLAARVAFAVVLDRCGHELGSVPELTIREAPLDLLPHFVLRPDAHLLHCPLQYYQTMQRRGSTIGAHDLLIAATAVAHGLSLATRNVREFRRVPGLTVSVW